MITLAVFVVLLIIVFAMILGRKHPMVPVALLSLTAGVLIGDTSFGHVMAHFVLAASAIFS